MTISDFIRYILEYVSINNPELLNSKITSVDVYTDYYDNNRIEIKTENETINI